MFWNKPNVPTSRRTSSAVENVPSNGKAPNSTHLDPTKRVSQQSADGSQPPPPQYGKTLGVPDPKSVPHVLPMLVSPAPLNPPRPAIMSTPKSSMASVKNPSTSINLSPTDTRPLLLVTSENNQQRTKTKTVPQGRRLPVNAGITTTVSAKTRQQPTIPINHHVINETTGTQRTAAGASTTAAKKYVPTRPRTALFFSSTRMNALHEANHRPHEHFHIGLDQSSEQRQPLLAGSGNDTSSRHDSLDSHTSTDDGSALTDHWQAAST